jgi:PTH1 family peptidyl-tRNA hydrolase
MISLVAFLGNYGHEYEQTRHNTAWLFASSLPFYNKFSWQQKFKGDLAVVEMKDFVQWIGASGLVTKKDGSTPLVPAGSPEKMYFLKPLTYMNLSGDSIGELAHFYKIKPEEILVVHDEIELPSGTISLKWSGGLGGHNGLRSVKTALGTADFWRLRFGLGKPDGKDIADYVLGSFTPDEKISLAQMFPPAADLFAKVLLSTDLNRLVPEWGKKKVTV